MDAQQFLAEFGHTANAPGGVGRLRELILALAFKGELCPQSQSRVDDLLADIEQQRNASNVETRKQRLVRQGTGSMQADGPYVLPANWRWVSLSTVGRTWGQKKPESDFVYIDVSSIDNKAGTLASTLEVLSSGAAPSRARKIVKSGTIIYSTVRPYLLNIAIIDREFDHEPIASTAFAVVHPWAGIEARYIYLYLRSPYFVRYAESVQIGMAYPAISDEKFYSGVVPLPPTEEQALIVAKVDELMALCDQLENRQQDRRKLQNALRQSTLQALASTESPHEMQESWQRLQGTFGHLFSEPADVKTLRASVLDLALVGYLSQGVPDEESVDAFLGRTRDAKALRLASGEMKRKVGAATDVVQLDVDIPAHWSRATFEELFQFIDYRGNTPTKTERGIVLVTAKNVRPGRLDREPVEYISESSYAEWMTRGFPKKGDLLFTTEAPLGNVALIEEPPTFALAQRVIDLQPFADLNTRCAMYFMLSPRFQSLLDKNSSGMTAKGIKAAKLKQLEIPVPPVPEQARIVSRVEQLLRICDRFEKELRDGNKAAERLAIALTAEVTGVAIEKFEEAAVKAPRTELIAPLRLGTLPGVKDQAPLATLLARQQGEMSARDLWQHFGGEIDAFYAQLKTEVAHGWITEPPTAEVRTKTAETAGD
jgi:type I restriction enzyme, S subunit